MQQYLHYKGNKYDYIGETVNEIEITESYHEVFEAAYSEAPDNLIRIYQFNYTKGIKYYVPHYPPLVIYKDQNGKVWARPVEMFFGYLEDGGKRFSLIEEDEGE